ncbi:hypothetical protein E4U42_008113 [Claviceps africana]|uniref:F-box domain-containing protein n=1 Tax=Claviceps africana TaxID=83212 RepID=A0A8K0NI28_9HYPO|nr:hypothetical protein E4U42_008113 [Claviceps africana]
MRIIGVEATVLDNAPNDVQVDDERINAEQVMEQADVAQRSSRNQPPVEAACTCPDLLTRFPAPILFQLGLTMDPETLKTFRIVSKTAKGLADCASENAAIIEHCPELLEAFWKSDGKFNSSTPRNYISCSAQPSARPAKTALVAIWI